MRYTSVPLQLPTIRNCLGRWCVVLADSRVLVVIRSIRVYFWISILLRVDNGYTVVVASV